MEELVDMRDDIVKVLFYMDLILLAIGFFLTSKTYFITVIIINIVLSGTYMIISKYSYMFDSQNKFLKSIGTWGKK